MRTNTNRPKAIKVKQFKNKRVIVTKWRFEPGAESGWHKHALDYVIVPGMNGNLLLETKKHDKQMTLTAGESYFKSAGVKHNVVNPNDFDFYFVEVELR
jgi:quercetin dioxygenase-like cupin family protein